MGQKETLTYTAAKIIIDRAAAFTGDNIPFNDPRLEEAQRVVDRDRRLETAQKAVNRAQKRTTAPDLSKIRPFCEAYPCLKFHEKLGCLDYGTSFAEDMIRRYGSCDGAIARVGDRVRYGTMTPGGIFIPGSIAR